MKKQKMIALGIVCLVIVSIGIVAAQNAAVGDSAVPIESTTLAQKCWQMSPYIDVLKLTISGGGQNYLLDGTEGAAGYYVLNNAGNMYQDPTDKLLHYGVTEVHDGIYFGGAHGLSMWGTLNPADLTGTWNIIGLDGSFPLLSGTLTPIPCPIGPYAPGNSGQAIGK